MIGRLWRRLFPARAPRAIPNIDIVFWSNGNTGVFDARGQQMTRLQEPWLRVYIEHLRAKGVVLEENSFVKMPDGSLAVMHFAADGSWNWEIRR